MFANTEMHSMRGLSNNDTWSAARRQNQITKQTPHSGTRLGELTHLVQVSEIQISKVAVSSSAPTPAHVSDVRMLDVVDPRGRLRPMAQECLPVTPAQMASSAIKRPDSTPEV